MPGIPNIQGPDRQRPLCYDPDEDRFVTLDDILEGKAKIVPIDQLTPEQQKRLAIERNRVGRDYTVTAITGPSRKRDDVIAEIEADTEFGRAAVEAEMMYLQDLLPQIHDGLRGRD